MFAGQFFTTDSFTLHGVSLYPSLTSIPDMGEGASEPSVGVDDPYEFVDACDYITDDGRCRFAIELAAEDRAFATNRRAEDYRCPVAGDRSWRDCRHFRSRSRSHECRRCGLGERRMAHDNRERPLLEEHHLSYGDGHGTGDHEITIMLCRWCHAKIHESWARVSDDVSPDPEAIAEREQRRAAEQSEAGFSTAAERRSR